MASLSLDSFILIIGSGTFGISTVYRLAKRGYKNITSLDRYCWPSPDSAAYDLNKIIRTEYDELLYTGLALEALGKWRKPEWERIYHETGRIACVSASYDSPEYQYFRDAMEILRDLGQGSKIEFIDGKQDVIKHCPQLQDAEGIEDWKGLWNSEAGWAHSRKALERWAKLCEEMGVKMISGVDGTVIGLEVNQDGTLSGIRVKSGKVYHADRYILCAGAGTAAVVPDLPMMRSWARCWTMAYLELTTEEMEKWRGIPVIDNVELGYAFEPDPETGWMKICNEFPGYSHSIDYEHSTSGKAYTLSTPRYASEFPDDKIPQEAVDGIYRFIDTVMPEFSGRPLIGARLCWCADTPDSHWLIDQHPDHSDILLATGDSVHAFKMFPIIGDYIADAMEGKARGLRAEWMYGNRKTLVDVTRQGTEIKDLRDVFDHI